MAESDLVIKDSGLPLSWCMHIDLLGHVAAGLLHRGGLDSDDHGDSEHCKYSKNTH